MASPYVQGTKSSSIFVSENVEVVEEKIKIKIDNTFQQAKYVIKYKLKVLKSGVQIPIVFQAKNYKNGFKVYLNDKRIEEERLPPQYIAPPERFENFKYLSKENYEVTIWWTENSGIVENLQNLKYFETDLPKGEHDVKIEYVSTPMLDKSKWVNEYVFQYALSPAKHWKKFGKLEIELDASEFSEKITTNLGEPKIGNKGEIGVWNFNGIPENSIEIKYIPKVSWLTKLLITIGPFGIALTMGILMCIVHLNSIKRNRKRSKSKYSWIVFVGSILIPLLFFILWMYAYDLIDIIIGEEAGGRHGYVFLTLFLYPIVMIGYLLITWQLDLYWKRNGIKKSAC